MPVPLAWQDEVQSRLRNTLSPETSAREALAAVVEEGKMVEMAEKAPMGLLEKWVEPVVVAGTDIMSFRLRHLSLLAGWEGLQAAAVVAAVAVAEQVQVDQVVVVAAAAAIISTIIPIIAESPVWAEAVAMVVPVAQAAQAALVVMVVPVAQAALVAA